VSHHLTERVGWLDGPWMKPSVPAIVAFDAFGRALVRCVAPSRDVQDGGFGVDASCIASIGGTCTVSGVAIALFQQLCTRGHRPASVGDVC